MTETAKHGVSGSDKPMAMKDRIIGFVIGAGMLALGIYMFVEPTSPLADQEEEPTRAKTRLIATIIDWIWGWPGGIVLVLLGLLVVVGVLMPKSKGDNANPADG